MKEYTIQMIHKGVTPADPGSISSPKGKFTSREQAMKALRSLGETYGKKGYSFRLLSREISEWKVESE